MLLYKNAFRDLLYLGGYMKNILIIEDDRMLNKGVAFALKKRVIIQCVHIQKKRAKN